MSLINHDYKYQIYTDNFVANTLTFSAVSYGKRHFEMVKKGDNWGAHIVLGVLESIPIIGLIVAIFERIIADRQPVVASLKSTPQTDKKVSQPAKQETKIVPANSTIQVTGTTVDHISQPVAQRRDETEEQIATLTGRITALTQELEQAQKGKRKAEKGLAESAKQIRTLTHQLDEERILHEYTKHDHDKLEEHGSHVSKELQQMNSLLDAALQTTAEIKTPPASKSTPVLDKRIGGVSPSKDQDLDDILSSL